MLSKTGCSKITRVSPVVILNLTESSPAAFSHWFDAGITEFVMQLDCYQNGVVLAIPRYALVSEIIPYTGCEAMLARPLYGEEE